MTAAAVQPGTRAVVIKSMWRYVKAFEAGMHTADDLTLQHEAERLEAQQTSPVVSRMRQIVDDERAARRATGRWGRCDFKHWDADDLVPGDFICTCDDPFEGGN